MRVLRRIGLFGTCCFVIGLSYLLVLRLTMAIWNSPLNPFYRPGIGLDINISPILALVLITLPYILGGIFLGLSQASRYALPVGLVTTLSERVLIFVVAAYVLGQFRQVMDSGEVYYVEGGPNLVGAIRSEALPYFDWIYIILGVPISIVILYLSARRIEQIRRHRIDT